MVFGLVCTFVGLLLSQVTQAASEVRHTVSFPKDKQQIFLVRSEFPVTMPVTELTMPNWTPGSYLIRDFPANVNRISATSADGTALPVQKISKDRWQVNTAQTDMLLVDYAVSTPVLNVSTSWASREFSLINGASVFLYTPQTADLPQQLKIISEPTRGEAFSAMQAVAGEGGYRAENYDELVDNPVAIARAPTYRFTHEGQDYVLLNVGENEFWDGQQAARDVEKIVAATQSFWGVNPLKRPYWFLNFIVGGKGGLEHDHSTVVMTGRRQMRDRNDYIKWLGIMAHEFFHVWNVRNMRPLGLAQYDYQNEQYTSQLWLAEGLTSYYDNLLMSRAGLITPREYLDLLAKDIYRLETTPGRLLRPVTEASLDAWIRHYQPNSNSLNTTISYYTKGAVIGFVLDTYIRKTSKGRHDLDEVMRKMYSLHSNKPYSSDAFERVVIDVGGVEAGSLLRTLLTTTTDLDVDTALEWYGLELNRGEILITGEAGEEPLRSDLGVLWDDEKTGLVVKSVLDGTGGSVAGLIPGDEILAVGGERLTKKGMDSLMKSFAPGEDTALIISRRGKIMTLDIRLDTAIPDRFEIVLKSDFGKSNIRRLQILLGQDPG
jgi:predicted metalloprotease with PDZ domain